MLFRSCGIPCDERIAGAVESTVGYRAAEGGPSYAAAAALILFAIVFTITYINLTVSRKTVQYV